MTTYSAVALVGHLMTNMLIVNKSGKFNDPPVSMQHVFVEAYYVITL